LKTLSSSKKAQGQIGSYVAVIGFLFLFAVVLFIMALVLNTAFDVFAASGLLVGQALEVSEKFRGLFDMFDYITVFLTLVLIAGIGITSFRVSASPVAFMVTYILAPVLGFIGYFLSHFFAVFVSNPLFIVTQLSYPRTIMIVTNLHWVMLVVIVVGSITLYGKRERGQFLPPQ